MKTKQLLEAEKATVAFAFGRFNPAHQGHIEVWRAVEQAGQKWFIGTNPSTLGPNDPLTFEQKSAWMAEIYPPIAGHIIPEQSVLTLAAYIFKKLRKNENASIAYITDETDWAWSGKLLNQYNGQEGAHGYYKFAQITHVPSPRVSSATALRDAARADDKVAFYHASGTDPKAKVAGLTYFDTVKQACEKYPLPVKKSKKIKEDEQGETGHETGNQLIPWPTGTTKVHVSDVYDWYKLGQVISDLDDADPKQFGQGQPQTVIAFGSEEEESKLLPLLKRLGLKVDDIDPKNSDIDEAYHAGALYDYLKNTKQNMSEEKQRLDAKCWTGYKKQGTKMKGDTRVNNCVKESVIKEATYTTPEVQKSPKTGKFWAWVYNNKGEKLAYVGDTADEAMKKLNYEVLDKHNAKVNAASKINANAVYSTWITKEVARNKAGIPAGTTEIWVKLSPGKVTISKSPVAGFKKAKLGGTQNSAYNILIKGDELEALGIKPSNRYELSLTDQSKDGITSSFRLDLHSHIYDTNDKLQGANDLPLMVIQQNGRNSMAEDSTLDEKSVSKAQFRTMAAVAHNPEFAKKVGISQEVGKEFHSADKNTNYKKLPKKVDEVLDPTTMSSNVLRYLGRKFATAFPWIATGAMGGALAYSGLLAPLMASVGGAAATITSLGAETALAAGVAGTYAAPSVIQVIKDLFAADENSIQAGIKRWVEKHVGDENDIQEFLNLHAQSAYLKQPVFRWRAEEWKTKMNPKEAEAYLEKHNKGWLDTEKQKVIDAEKAKADTEKKHRFKVSYYDPKTRQNKVVKINARNKDEVLDYCANKGYTDVTVEETVGEGLDADQKRAGQVGGKEKAKKIGTVLGTDPKQHPYKGRLVGEAEDHLDEIDRRGFLKGLGAAAVAGAAGSAMAKNSKIAIQVGKLVNGDWESVNARNAKKFMYIQQGSQFGIKWIDSQMNMGAIEMFAGGDKGNDARGRTSYMFLSNTNAIKIIPNGNAAGDTIMLTPRSELSKQGGGWLELYYEVDANMTTYDDKAQQGYNQKQGPEPIKLTVGMNKKEGDIVKMTTGPHTGKRVKITQLFSQTDPLPNGKQKALGVIIESVEQGVAEDFNGEYDDEAGMAKSNLLTTARAVAGLLKTIQDNDNLPEWGQEKIAKAEMMLVSIWDYLQSQKEQGIDPKVEGVTEAEIDFGPEWDEIVKRVGQRAKQGPLKTVWDEKKRVYKNVPVNDPDQPSKEVDEASLATMRDYFAGNDDARDPTKLAQMRDFFNKNKLPSTGVKDKRFASKQAYELWLKQNGLRDLSSK